jgi:predicted RNA-binding protein with PUA-like domain
MKTEPDCFSVDDLAALPGRTTSWDGVRNYQARNLLRDEIKEGDQVLFYHSGARPTGIAGLCTVVRPGYPDHTARDPEGDHFDPRATEDNPIWYMVDVRLDEKLPAILPLSELKKAPGLEKMMVCQRGAMLSVQPVRLDEWKVILRLIKAMKAGPAPEAT